MLVWTLFDLKLSSVHKHGSRAGSGPECCCKEPADDTPSHAHSMGVPWPQLSWSVMPVATLLARTCLLQRTWSAAFLVAMCIWVHVSTQLCVRDLMVSMRLPPFQMLLNLFCKPDVNTLQLRLTCSSPESFVAQKPLNWTQRTVFWEGHLCWQSIKSLLAAKPWSTCPNIQSYVATQCTVIRASTLQSYLKTLRKLSL